MIAALAPDQARALRLPARIPVSERDLQRGIGGLRAGIAEENMVEIARRERGDAARKLKGARMGELE